MPPKTKPRTTTEANNENVETSSKIFYLCEQK